MLSQFLESAPIHIGHRTGTVQARQWGSVNFILSRLRGCRIDDRKFDLLLVSGFRGRTKRCSHRNHFQAVLALSSEQECRSRPDQRGRGSHV